MPIDYRDKPSGDWDPTSISKVESESTKDVATISRHSSQANKSGWSSVTELFKQLPAGKRIAIKSKQLTTAAETALILAETARVRAITDQHAALREKFDGEILNEQYWKDERDKEVELNRKLADMDRTDKLEQRQHELDMARREREAAKNLSKSPTKKTKRRKTFEEQAEEILEFGNVGPHTRIAQRKVEEWVANAGGNENLTDELRENIQELLQTAAKEDLSKS